MASLSCSGRAITAAETKLWCLTLQRASDVRLVNRWSIRPADNRRGSVRRQPWRRVQLDFLEGFDLLLSDVHTGEFADQAPVFVEPGADGDHAIDHPPAVRHV